MPSLHRAKLDTAPSTTAPKPTLRKPKGVRFRRRSTLDTKPPLLVTLSNVASTVKRSFKRCAPLCPLTRRHRLRQVRGAFKFAEDADTVVGSHLPRPATTRELPAHVRRALRARLLRTPAGAAPCGACGACARQARPFRSCGSLVSSAQLAIPLAARLARAYNPGAAQRVAWKHGQGALQQHAGLAD